MKRIDFIYDWNGKLSAATIFTTIRKWSESREFETGDRVEVYLNDRFLFVADVLGKLPDEGLSPHIHLIRMLDTGSTTAERASGVLERFTKGEPSEIIILRRSQNQLFD